MSYEFETKEMETTTYIGVRKNNITSPEISTALAEILPKVFVFLQENNITPLSPPLTLYHCHNEEKGTFDIQGGFFIADKIEAVGEIECGEIQKGTIVSTKHVGSYSDLGKAHEAVYNWIKEQGQQANQPCWEIYLNDPGEVKPEECATEVVYSIK